MFRRDLRLQDNTGLLQALDESEQVLCCFIFDPRQVEEHKYRSVPALQFMLESLEDLDQQLQNKGGLLACYVGEAENVLHDIITSEKIDAVFLNKDYTPFSQKRDQALQKICDTQSVVFSAHDDALLQPIGTVRKKDGNPYTVFTPFMRAAREHTVPNPVKNTHKQYVSSLPKKSQKIADVSKKILKQRNDQLAIHGGTAVAEKTLRKIGTFTDYKETRDVPAQSDGTTHLSPHQKFGTVSVREVYHLVRSQLGADHGLLAELYWRDFFTNIAWHFPQVFGHAFHAKYDKIEWSTNKKNFEAWCQGQTGFPIVDAGMRELNATGYMHNRVRMITASFLVKDLHISWRWGEQYFARQLVDYDPAVNNGNWQWAASTGCDAQPYFRVFNPWLQQKKYDPDCLYIKRWIPELADLSAKEIHKLEKGQPPLGYPGQMVDHANERDAAKSMYKNM